MRWHLNWHHAGGTVTTVVTEGNEAPIPTGEDFTHVTIEPEPVAPVGPLPPQAPEVTPEGTTTDLAGNPIPEPVAAHPVEDPGAFAIEPEVAP